MESEIRKIVEYLKLELTPGSDASDIELGNNIYNALWEMELCFLPPDDVSEEDWRKEQWDLFVKETGTREDFIQATIDRMRRLRGE